MVPLVLASLIPLAMSDASHPSSSHGAPGFRLSDSFSGAGASHLSSKGACNPDLADYFSGVEALRPAVSVDVCGFGPTDSTGATV